MHKNSCTNVDSKSRLRDRGEGGLTFSQIGEIGCNSGIYNM